jgi:hypothetical protein
MIAISTEEIEKLEKSRTPQFNQFLHRLQIGKFTLATKSVDGLSNVAIFSSITHLGSSPAMIGRLHCNYYIELLP